MAEHSDSIAAQSIVLIDGYCPVCTGWAAFINKRDKTGRLSVVAQETDRGRTLLKEQPSNLSGLDSVFFVDESGRWSARSSATIHILLRLPLPYRLGAIIWMVPRPIRDAAYDLYASRRRRTI
tara:strand:- start:53 stop:421 length:369 start_codon:yes stop_codon:yes gene_type:complete